MRRREFGASLLASLPGTLLQKRHRTNKHRNLFNGDCCVYFYNPEIWQPEGLPYSAKAIHRFIDNLVANGVDTFVINPSVHVAYYPSRQLPTMLDGYRRGDKNFFRAAVAASGAPMELREKALSDMTAFFNLYLDLIEGGVDWFRETVNYSKEKRLAIWSSLRMNDTHGGGDPEHIFDSGPLYRQSRYRFRGSTVPNGDAAPAHFVGLNYAFPQVREYMLSFVKEQVAYGAEGIELDWLRDPICIPAPATERDLDAMTAFMRDVRSVAVSVGLRIPANLGYLRSIGLDIRRWAREGLIDFVSFGSYWQCVWDSPLDEIRKELGERVAIYGVIEGAANLLKCRSTAATRGGLDGARLQQLGDNIAGAQALASDTESFRYSSSCPEILRANAAGKLALGASGIETFNFYVGDQVRIPGVRSEYQALKDLGNLEALRGQNKLYCLSTLPKSGFYGWESVEPVPFQLAAGTRRELRLSMCAEPKERALRLVVQVVVKKETKAKKIGISFNECWPSFSARSSRKLLFAAGSFNEHSAENEAMNFEFDAGLIREGWNTVIVMNCEESEALEVASIELGVGAGFSRL